MAIRIHLFGGECDGYQYDVTSLKQPDLIYAYWPGYAEKIKAMRDPIARVRLKQSLETLCYRYRRTDTVRDDHDTVMEYERDITADKPLPVDADL
jgi:hypothetical protein